MRYCVPRSEPTRFSVVGSSTTSKKTSASRAYVTLCARYATSTASACPVVPAHTSAYVGVRLPALRVADARVDDARLAIERELEPQKQPPANVATAAPSTPRGPPAGRRPRTARSVASASSEWAQGGAPRGATGATRARVRGPNPEISARKSGLVSKTCAGRGFMSSFKWGSSGSSSAPPMNFTTAGTKKRSWRDGMRRRRRRASGRATTTTRTRRRTRTAARSPRSSMSPRSARSSRRSAARRSSARRATSAARAARTSGAARSRTSTSRSACARELEGERGRGAVTGRLVVELFDDVVPRTVRHFVGLVAGGDGDRGGDGARRPRSRAARSRRSSPASAASAATRARRARRARRRPRGRRRDGRSALRGRELQLKHTNAGVLSLVPITTGRGGAARAGGREPPPTLAPARHHLRGGAAARRSAGRLRPRRVRPQAAPRGASPPRRPRASRARARGSRGAACARAREPESPRARALSSFSRARATRRWRTRGAPNGEPKEAVRIVDCGLLENAEAAEAAHIECTVPRQRREKQQESKERIMCARGDASGAPISRFHRA